MVYVRIFNIDYPSLQILIEEIRGKAKLIYMIDYDKRKRYIYDQADTYDNIEQI